MPLNAQTKNNIITATNGIMDKYSLSPNSGMNADNNIVTINPTIATAINSLILIVLSLTLKLVTSKSILCT